MRWQPAFVIGALLTIVGAIASTTRRREEAPEGEGGPVPGPKSIGCAMLEPETIRRLARDLVVFAAGGEEGRPPEGDEIYRDVTEGRQDEAKRLGIFYSSCGDLPQWLAFRLGIRSRWVNREEHSGWRIGRNLVDLESAPETVNVSGPLPAEVSTGDVLRVGDAGAKIHTFVVLDVDRNAGTITSADYGQPGSKVVTRPLSVRDGQAFVGERPVRKWLSIVEAVRGACERGEFVAPEAVV